MPEKIDLKKAPRAWFLLSPVGLAAFSYAVFWVCVLLPPAFYKEAMNEENRMFMDPASIAFVSLCIAAFVIGTKFARNASVEWGGQRRVMSPLVLLLFLSAALALNIVSVVLLAQNNPELLTYVFMGDEDAEQIRNYLDYTAALAEALPFLIASIFWVNYRRREMLHVLGTVPFVLTVALYFSIVVGVFTCVLKLARYELMPLLFGFWLSGVLADIRFGAVDLRGLGRQAVFLLVIILGAFFAFSWLRSGQDEGALIRSLMGYGPASYNRLAAVLDDSIRVPTMGSGVNVFPALFRIPVVSRFLDLNEIFQLPSVEVARAGEFVAVARAGLDAGYNWVTTFGYIYYDLGWASPVAFLVLGYGAQRLWYGVRRGRGFSLVMYPFFAFSILIWFGFNYLTKPSLFTWIFAGFCVVFLEKVFFLKTKKT